MRKRERRDGAAPEPRSYYGRPVIKPPVWKPEIPWYLFLGGLAGASAALACGAGVTGNRELARNAGLIALAGGTAQPGAADHRPRPARALLQHAAGLQGDLADERRLVDPRRHRAPTAASRPRTRCSACSRASAPLARGSPRPARAAARDLHRGAARRTRRCPPGTRRGASCRSSSPAAPRRAPVPRRLS